MDHGDILDWHVHVVNFELKADTLNEMYWFSQISIDKLNDLPADARV